MSDSVRKQVLMAIVEAYKDVEPDPDAADPWPIKFSEVELGPLGAEDFKKRFTLGVVPGPEKYSDLYPFIARQMRVAIEFRITVNKGDPSPHSFGEDLLEVVERVVLKDRHWGGLVLDTKLLNNEIDTQTYSDRSVAGVLFIEVHYRHSRDDSRSDHPSQ